MRRLAPLLPSERRGKPRVDDRRVLSGIVHVLRSGCPWRHAPREYGPPKTLHNRFLRWAIKGVWRRLFEALAAAGGPPAEVLRDATDAKAHRSASGGKGGSTRKPSGGRTAAGPARSTPRQTRPASRSRSTSPVATQPTSAAARRRSRLFPEGALVIADRAFDADRFRGAIEAPAAVPRTEGVRRTNRRCPEDTSRRRQTGAARAASAPRSTAVATPSSASSAG
jgi:transposase